MWQGTKKSRRSQPERAPPRFISTMRATPVLSAVALASSCRGGVVTTASTSAAALAAGALHHRPVPSSSAGAASRAHHRSSRRRGGTGEKREPGSRGSGSGSGAGRSTLLFQCLSSSSAMRGLTQARPRRGVRSIYSTSAGVSSAGSSAVRRRGSAGRRVRPAATKMANSSPPVTDKDIMREFVSVAASEASSAVKNKPPSAVLAGNKQHNGDAGRGVTAEAAEEEGGGGDKARPTGYMYGDVLTDADGLPLVYDSDSIGRYWDKRPGELNSRWSKFLSVTVPFVTRVVRDYTSGNIMKNEAVLARDLRIVIEKLGPTFIKLGQALSIRPDVIGPAATDELAKLQDAVPPFPTPLAMEVLERELGRPPSEVFSEISEEPIAAASLAQMTDYNELLRVWATGFYQELDFLNEANNQIRMKKVLSGMKGQVFVPDVLLDLSTRRVLVSEWVDGVKLTKADPSEIRELTSIAQEAFLVQLLGEGFMHCDPHPGNMLLVDESMRDERGRLALLDYGLMAELGSKEREGMVRDHIQETNTLAKMM
ncbi:Predicted unusual protein kinase (ISS) [Ectocarpus siliculosus]|uniref:Predicted unusual protein kinase (ISS) n=1 Tax=Ectocarpus siliculosus TaxID=2880 RepID=D7FYF3_ECTSI|nr:Predicted unusual protein kinase (ISS) [Ectocarpus siliculosus]|eukprot:CBJ32495.1 Predicted unusual protein kinase (ISS) [Ectocarpus siliculosus]